MPDKNAYYFMEDERENQRLASKVNAEAFVETYLTSYLSNASSVLDVGCGPGVIARAVGKAFPGIHVTALDSSPKKLEETRKNISGMTNVTARIGDVKNLPFEADRFDFVFSRFLFEYLPEPEHAVSEMFRVCSPAGRILIQDLDGQLVWHYPEDNALKSKIEKVLEHLTSATGFDPFVGRKLYYLLCSEGMRDIHVQAEPYHLFPGRMDEKNFKLWELKLDIVMPQIIKALGSETEAMQCKKAYLDYLLREDTLTYSVVFTVTGVKQS